ncbi:tRNA (guanosine(37)-N1)-methyltransferase TrmD [Mollicutes bacterium LVI A0078]|nr:tRNA (guanosine(37)-N1)-methyltransferase TrmD [Mollicutes bacterium LVI A0075]WOO90347.1 tRNA (guanosine(37)-N1)-methyltransferase TrmD [Mollicutes bacterium LVI A0078]
MKINILTLFPGLYESFMNEAIVSRAVEKGIVEFNIIDFREYSTNKHKKVDDYVFGGGAGMLIKPQPLFDAIRQNNLENTHIINTSPRGNVFTQQRAFELAEMEEITFMVGRYEGIDQRVIDTFVDEELSIGDYILMGGEIPSQVMLESIIRLLPGVLNNSVSFATDSFSSEDHYLLEEDMYTRPAEFEGMEVPEVLLSGHHANIQKWKYENAYAITEERRPDLIEKEKHEQEKNS